MRLFAGLRELAGSGQVEVGGSSVGEAIAEAEERYGAAFSSTLLRSRVWVNGEEARPDTPLGPEDEIAILPPVSGGAGRSSGSVGLPALAPVGAAIAVLVANQLSVGWWAAVVVGLVGAWVADLSFTVNDQGRDLPAGPVLTSLLLAALAAHRFGFTGVVVGVVVAVILPMGWAVLSDSSRMVSILAPMVLVGLIGALAVGSLIVAQRWADFGTDGVNVLVGGLVIGVVASALADRIPQSPLGDPIMSGGLATLVGTIGLAAIFSQDLVVFSLLGAVDALALVSGRSFGSVIRTRSVRLTDLPVGTFALLDGPMLAAAVFLPVYHLFV